MCTLFEAQITNQYEFLIFGASTASPIGRKIWEHENLNKP
jgi:hypothetical protein